MQLGSKFNKELISTRVSLFDNDSSDNYII